MQRGRNRNLRDDVIIGVADLIKVDPALHSNVPREVPHLHTSCQNEVMARIHKLKNRIHIQASCHSCSLQGMGKGIWMGWGVGMGIGMGMGMEMGIGGGWGWGWGEGASSFENVCTCN